MAGRRLATLVLSDAERSELGSLAGRRNTAQALALRARIVLHSATGLENQQVAADLRIDKTTVGKWCRRFVEHRIDGFRVVQDEDFASCRSDDSRDPSRTRKPSPRTPLHRALKGAGWGRREFSGVRLAQIK